MIFAPPLGLHNDVFSLSQCLNISDAGGARRLLSYLDEFLDWLFYRDQSGFGRYIELNLGLIFPRVNLNIVGADRA